MSKGFKSIVLHVFGFICLVAALITGVFSVHGVNATWLSYEDFLYEEVDKAFLDPEFYLGYTAQFNFDEYINLEFASISDDSVVSVIEIVDDYDSSNDDYDVLYQDNPIVTISDYFYDSEEDKLWYKIDFADDYNVPESIKDYPYVYHANGQYGLPSLIMLPKKAMLTSESIDIYNEMIGTSSFITLNKTDVPSFFDVTYKENYNGNTIWTGYDLGDISKWNESYDSQYRYVTEASVILIPAEVTIAYEELLSAKDTEEYYEILESIPEDILNQFMDLHKTNVKSHINELVRLENIEYKTNTTINGVSVPVLVKGKIPETGVELSVTPVDNDTVINEGFEIERKEDIITALDIKMLNIEDGTEWQPEKGECITVSIGVGSLGYEDGRIFQLHHKHDDYIDKYNVFLVENGSLTVHTNGFSMYVVSDVGETTRVGNTINDGGTVNLKIGDEVVYYFTTTNTHEDGTWAVEDTEGAIHYTVHVNGTPGNGGVYAQWIKIIALKETTTPIKLSYTYNYTTGGGWWGGGNYSTNTETYNLNITPPKAESSQRLLYLKDDVNNSGRIIATLVDESGNEIPNGLDGASYSWERTDGLFITPNAYEDNNRSVNIARDHGGLVEARKNSETGEYDPVTYTVKVFLSDGTDLNASYTVYYQSEIINANFESPKLSTPGSYSFFMNGYPNLFWKTTAPGTGEHVSKDIEYANIYNGEAGTDFGVNRAGDYDSGGVQFAELNAEAFGALYQDIITAPGEDIEWKFSHAPRRNQSWASDISNAMFIVIGATEEAQKLTTQAQLEELTAKAKNNDTNNKITTDGVFVRYGDDDALYKVWYHDAGKIEEGGGASIYENDPYGWTKLEGSYTTPEGQYRTRLFFVSERTTQYPNAGNLIDIALAGQYKSYLIEYYEESFNSGVKTTTHKTQYDQEGEALIYSSVNLTGLVEVEKEEHDFLHKILINGKNYPYDIRYAGDESIYIEKYEGTPTDPFPDVGKSYEGYDIVVQIYVRDTVIALQKEIEFPESITTEQKLQIIEKLNASKDAGYVTKYDIYSKGDVYNYLSQDTISITSRGPNGKYTGYISPNNNPSLGHTYYVSETYQTQIDGLELDTVTFSVVRYKYGEAQFEPDTRVYKSIDVSTNVPLTSTPILLEENGYKIAEISVTNTYVEKMTTIKYKAIGKGKVALIGDNRFTDTPSETLAYYSGKAIGAAVHPGKGATFVGWYKDEACSIPVETVDGYWNTTTNTFKPNTNILNADEVTFYAKFESGSITINRENGDPGQIYVYNVSGNGLNFNITVSCDETGKGTTEIFEIAAGTYTVTELTDHTWRFATTSTQTKTVSGSPIRLEYTFGEKKTGIYWVNGYSESKKNVYGGS